ncbi:MAG: tetratricopeptide repeat protein [Desulfovibrionaceae bacterium]|nr:tetratricopeptide repeat protein [Desulfovibrionaceae bacterium]
MKNLVVAALLLVALALAGCAKVVGPYYLNQEKYKEGIQVLGDQLRENPRDASSAYYVGRYYLALNKPKDGLPYLEKAVALAPENADYVFWTGVAHWAMLDFERERAAYRKALSLDPGHVSANLYLGHGYVDQGEWAKALKRYDTVIKLDKYNPEALFYRGVALNGLGKTTEEIAAWKKLLEYYPAGSLGMQATARLNLHGDFSYRNYIIGKRNITLKSMTFKPGSNAPDARSKETLHVLSALLETNKDLVVHVVSYVEGDARRARERAQAVRDYMLAGHPDIGTDRLPLSWFGTAEKVEAGNKTFPLAESVNFITEVR